MILSQHLTTVASRNPTGPAIHYLGKDTNYTELRTKIARLSYLYLSELGANARVAFLARNSPAYIETFIALSNTRSLTIPVDPELTIDQCAEWIKESKATHVAVTSDLTGKAREVLSAARLSLPIIEIEKKKGGEYDSSFTPPSENAPLDTDNVLLLRTAGATGKPKFVPLNHKAVQHAAVALRSPYHLGAGERVLTTLPWSTPFALVHGMLMPIMLGATCVIDHGLEKKEFLDFLRDSRVGRLVGTPRSFLQLLLVCKDLKQTPVGLKSVTVGMGQLSPEVNRAFDLLKIPAAHVYGQSESVWTLAMQDVEDARPKADKTAPPSRPAPKGLMGMKYKVLDENGDEIPVKKAAAVGQLAITGPAMMSGYLDRERETKIAIRGTWLHTGDIVKLEEDGESTQITFLSRKEDSFVREGKRVFSNGPDASLKGVAGVQDCAGFVLRNSKGEGALACAVVKAQGSALTEKQLLDACNQKQQPHEQVAIIVFTDVIPRDSAGGIDRSKIRNQFAGIVG